MTAAEPRTIVLTRLLWKTCPLPEDPGRHSSRPTDEDCIIPHQFKLWNQGIICVILGKRSCRFEFNFTRNCVSLLEVNQ